MSVSVRSIQILGAAALLTVATADSAFAQGLPFLDGSDSVFAIDADGKVARGTYPAAESPSKILDGNTATKYLSTGGAGSGFIVTPSFVSPLESFQITTANDAAGRDPASWQIYGFNGSLTTVDSGPSPAVNPSGLDEAWTLLDSGAVTLPETRLTAGPLVNITTGGVGYDHYKVIFPSLRDPFNTLMQIAEFQFFSDDAGTSPVLTNTDPVIGVHFGDDSRHPNGERPALALDQVKTTKYLNFGEENSGMIITNSEGPVEVGFMRLTTANDAPDRDPSSFELYGTNEAIESLNNSDGNGGETWTLIASGALSLPALRGDSSTLVAIDDSPLAYTSYKLVFPTVNNPGATNSMQIADVQFYAVPEPGAMSLGLGAVAMLASRRRRRA